MSKTVALYISLLTSTFYSNHLASQNHVQRFQKVYDFYSAFAHKVRQVPGNGYVLVGATQDSGQVYSSAFIVKVDRRGDIQWSKLYHNVPYYVGATDIIDVPGGYLVTAYSSQVNPLYNRLLLIKVDSTGNLQWVKEYGMPGSTYPWFIERARGNGFVFGGNINDDLYLIEVDSIGNIVWTKTLGGIGTYEEGTDVKILSTGEILVCGSASGGTYLAKFDQSGSLLWNQLYTYPYASVTTWAIEENLDHDILIAGVHIPNTGGFAPYLLKVDAGGTVLWCNRYEGPWVVSEFFSIGLAADGGIIASIEPEVFNNIPGSDMGMVKIDNEGNPEWCRLYNHGTYNFPWGVIPTRDRGYGLVGRTLDTTNQHINILFVKTDSLGQTGCSSDTLLELTASELAPQASSTGVEGSYNSMYSYSLTSITPNLTDTFFCRDSISSVPVPFQPVELLYIQIPNVFTPNGDGINDAFFIKQEGLVSLHCTIMNRWGIKVAELSELQQSWDGRTGSGQEAPAGVYYYIFNGRDKTGQEHDQTGFVQLLR